ncbi:branched-chain amino acid ABC transporter permease [uncultured Limnohabitans sp.]|jgi:ABC-type branched-subunit amino acid transport system permease subunit|uniref:branched-chain amino acid ABC transporter permease n=1 Tax=uncultured Limnohabitans sp. TaxID=768543 RepID=UPI00262E8ACE|nr:branched-chain amino acid ABC transporter permease [uncultured Limnohabitans sp.]
MHTSPLKTLRMGALLVVVFLLAGLAMPKWLLFLSTMALSHGLVSLGIVIQMRSDVVSFGQGFVFAAGGYATALAANHLGVTDAILMVLVGGFAATLCTLPFAPLLSRYRGIFFAMLTLAISMVLYGILVKTESLGGSDGFNVSRPTLFGHAIEAGESNWLLYNLAVVVVGIIATLARIYADSVRGLVSLAIRENELRVEYLGASVSQSIAFNFLIAAFMGGAGGALTLMSLGHIDPNFSYWTTSGEFVFVAILAGHQSMLAVFLGSFVVEVVRSFSNLYFPNTWQLAMGLFLLVVIRFLPRGLGSLWMDKRAKKETPP